jgi:hypothetical protein
MVEHIKSILILILAGTAVWLGARADVGGRTAESDVITVAAARYDIEAGTPLTEDMLETRTLPRAYAQAGAYQVLTMGDLRIPAAYTATVRIPKGDQVTQNCLKVSAPAAAPAATTDRRLQAQTKYLEGLKYFQNSNYPKARAEWQTALKLDPKNEDAKAGLKRIEMIQAGSN